MKTTILPFASMLTLVILTGCKPATESHSAAASADPAPVTPAEIQGPSTTATGLIEIPVAADGAAPQLLSANETVSGSFKAPQTGDVRTASIQIGNFGGTSDGTVSLKLCQAEECQEATTTVIGSTDNSYLDFHLPTPLTVTAGNPVIFTFTRIDGVQPFAIWTYPTGSGGELALPDATKTPRDAKIALTF